MTRSRKLLLFNYTMDPVNQVFSHQVAVALKLSKNFDDFYVITSDHGEVEFGREKFPIVTLDWNKVGKIRKIWSLYFQTLRALIFFQPTHVFYHMVDTHCSLVSPIFRIFQIPQILWYAHTSNSKPLIFSSFFVNRILTSTTASFPSKSKRMAQKVRAIGQGIDVGLFPQLWKTSNDIDSAVSVGRLDRSKGLMQILQVLGNERRIPEGFRIAFIGSPITEGSSEYVIESLRNAKHSYPHIEVALLGKIPRFELGTEIAKYDFFIHAFQGSLDKVLLEATLIGIPVITHNIEYHRIFGTWSGSQSPSLSEELNAFLNLPNCTVVEICKSRRVICVNNHSLEQWIDKITFQINETSRR